MKSSHREIIGLAGIGLVSSGVAAIYLPAGFVVMGLFFIAAALIAKSEK